ncbi:MAG: ATP-binding protein [Nitrospinota bacterium]|nr:ATP-binding protein [Nitrospinota bacterium]
MKLGPLLDGNGLSILPVMDSGSAVDLYVEHLHDLAMIIAEVTHSADHLKGLAELNFKSSMLPFILIVSTPGEGLVASLLDYGVRDYLIKPVAPARFMAVVSNAIARAPHPACSINPLGSGAGLSDLLVIPSKSEELPRALEWIRNRTEKLFGQGEIEKFLCFLNELLLNAHEHGNLRISEDEKAQLLEMDAFHLEVESRENQVDAMIEISIAIDDEKVEVNITDEGGGFDFLKYVNMSREDLEGRLFSPCGRGIFIMSHYFDGVKYSKGGSSVTITKALAGAGNGVL